MPKSLCQPEQAPSVTFDLLFSLEKFNHFPGFFFFYMANSFYQLPGGHFLFCELLADQCRYGFKFFRG